MVAFNDALSRAVVTERRFGRVGSPWEFNLRDVLRWCELVEAAVPPSLHAAAAAAAGEDAAIIAAAASLFPVVYLHRMRTAEDRAATRTLFALHFGGSALLPAPPALSLSAHAVHVGVARLERSSIAVAPDSGATLQHLLLREQLPSMEAAAAALSRGWMVALVGPAASGKTALARSLSCLAGAKLHEVRRIASALVACSPNSRPNPTRALEMTKKTLCFD
jgi:midasin